MLPTKAAILQTSRRSSETSVAYSKVEKTSGEDSLCRSGKDMADKTSRWRTVPSMISSACRAKADKLRSDAVAKSICRADGRHCKKSSLSIPTSKVAARSSSKVCMCHKS